MNYKTSLIFIAIVSAIFLQFVPIAHAQEASSESGDKYLGAGIAFAGAAIGAGMAVGRAGSASLAAAAENESMKTQGLIITALGEAIAIYGIVVALLMLS